MYEIEIFTPYLERNRRQFEIGITFGIVIDRFEEEVWGSPGKTREVKIKDYYTLRRDYKSKCWRLNLEIHANDDYGWRKRYIRRNSIEEIFAYIRRMKKDEEYKKSLLTAAKQAYQKLKEFERQNARLIMTHLI